MWPGVTVKSPLKSQTQSEITYSPTFCESPPGAQRKGWRQGRRPERASILLGSIQTENPTCFLNLFKPNLQEQKPFRSCDIKVTATIKTAKYPLLPGNMAYLNENSNPVVLTCYIKSHPDMLSFNCSFL